MSTDRLVTTAYAALDNPEGLFDHLLEHMEEGELSVERVSERHARVVFESTALSMEQRDQGLYCRIESPDISNLQFWREGAVERIAEHAPEAARALRWSDSIARLGEGPPNSGLRRLTR